MLPAEGSAATKALLWALDEGNWNELLAEAPAPQVHDEIARARRPGYACNIGEVDPGIHAVAAAVTSCDGRPVAALVVCGPASRLTEAEVPAAGRLVAEHAAELSALVG